MPDLPLTNPNTFFPRRLLNEIDNIVEQASDSESPHHRMENICQRLKIPYYRFNPTLQLRAELTATVSLDEWCALAKDYMNSNAEQVNQLCALFSEKTRSMSVYTIHRPKEDIKGAKTCRLSISFLAKPIKTNLINWFNLSFLCTKI